MIESIAKLAPRSTYAAGAATRFVEDRLRRGQVSFTLAEVVTHTGLSVLAARHQLLRLGPQVVRVAPRQPFFLAVSPEHQLIGAPPAAWWLDAYFQWLRHPYYLALQSAAAEYRSRAQAIQAVQVVTDVPRRRLELGRIRVVFHVKRNVSATPIQSLANAYAPLRVSTPAATVIDLVRYVATIGGMERATETLAPLLPQIKSATLAAALDAEPEVATLQRFGYLLETLGYAALANQVHRRLPRKLNRVRLAPGPDRAGHEYVGRWALVANAAIARAAP